MGLETGTYISDLVPTNPVSTDRRRQGDDHFRLVKAVLQATFPNADRPFRFPTTVEKTANYTVVAADQNKRILVDASAGAVTISLPATSPGSAGWCVEVVKTDRSSNAVTLSAAALNINGVDSIPFSRYAQSAFVVWDGTEYWMMLSHGLRKCDPGYFDEITFVSFGQSNMAGHETADTGDKTTDASVYAWVWTDNDGTGDWQVATLGTLPFREIATRSISNITQANPGVVTYTGTNIYQNGDEVDLSDVVGMTQVNGNSYTIANLDTDAKTFELAATDTTAFTAYTSGGTITGPFTTPNNQAFHLAKKLRTHFGVRVNIIHFAVPATDMESWMTTAAATAAGFTAVTGTGNNFDSTTALSGTLSRTKVQNIVTAALTELGKTKVDFVYFDQGENSAFYGNYRIQQLTRAWLDMMYSQTWMNADTPILMVGMSDRGDYHNVNTVYQDIAASAEYPWMTLVSANGVDTTYADYPEVGDFTHFSGTGLVELADRAKEALLALWMLDTPRKSEGSLLNRNIADHYRILSQEAADPLAPVGLDGRLSNIIYLLSTSTSEFNYLNIMAETLSRGTRLTVMNYGDGSWAKITATYTAGDGTETAVELNDPRELEASVSHIWIAPREYITFERQGPAADGPLRVVEYIENPRYRSQRDPWRRQNQVWNGSFHAMDSGWYTESNGADEFELIPEFEYTITNISVGAGIATITFSDTTRYLSDGDLITISSVTGITGVNNQDYAISSLNYGTKQFVLADPDTGSTTVAGSWTGSYTSGGVITLRNRGEWSGSRYMHCTPADTLAVELFSRDKIPCRPNDVVHTRARFQVCTSAAISSFRQYLAFFDRNDDQIGSDIPGLGVQTVGEGFTEQMLVERAPARTEYAKTWIRLAATGGNAGTVRVTGIEGWVDDSANGRNLGDVTTGPVNLALGDGPFQYYTNNGAHSLVVPTSDVDYQINVLITNGATAGNVTLSGHTFASGDAFTTTNGHQFIVTITCINSTVLCERKALQ